MPGRAFVRRYVCRDDGRLVLFQGFQECRLESLSVLAGALFHCSENLGLRIRRKVQDLVKIVDSRFCRRTFAAKPVSPAVDADQCD